MISTHALREEGDHKRCWEFDEMLLFLPTPSARRATAFTVGTVSVTGISTHALREEGDHPGGVR